MAFRPSLLDLSWSHVGHSPATRGCLRFVSLVAHVYVPLNHSISFPWTSRAPTQTDVATKRAEIAFLNCPRGDRILDHRSPA